MLIRLIFALKTATLVFFNLQYNPKTVYACISY